MFTSARKKSVWNTTTLALLGLLATGAGAQASESAHYVVRGDTLYGIARQYNTSVADILALNGLKSHSIRPGQQLLIPGISNVTSQQSYTVRRGDSLSLIAKKFGLSVAEVKSTNRLRSSLIKPGQVLFIPGDSEPSFHGSQAITHIVKRGDTLWDISRKYQISVSNLRRENGISKGAALIPGQKLAIPAASGLPIANTDSLPTPEQLATSNIRVESSSVIVVDAETGSTLFQKDARKIKSIASITKLMTAMVTLDAQLPMDEVLTISSADVDRLKFSSSRLPVGTKLNRRDMLHLALMSSENRAASALSRHFPGGKSAFIDAMNQKAKVLGMHNTRFADATGLTPKNISTAEDLAKMVAAASKYDAIRTFTTDDGETMRIARVGTLQYRNTNPLVRNGSADISVSKTGYIREAGRCLAMATKIGNRPAYMVLLQSGNKLSPSNDAQRLTKWIESGAAGINLAGL